MTPREAIRITRFQKALKRIRRVDLDTLANVALESGYFDQPHMVREFKALISNSPVRLKKSL
jgi:AraC-like DNA-binding protein